tara:strand:+ start:1261 stop:2517 length:1257 start_codon:yes stop_codon:yes gene_type:complete
MRHTFRKINEAEFSDYVRTMFWSAGRIVDDEFIRERRAATQIDGAFGLFSQSNMVATIGTKQIQISVPGGEIVPLLVIGQGGVLPGHQGRGLMREMMTQTLEGARRSGFSLCGWTTSEWPLYERYGGGPATYVSSFSVQNRRTRIRANLLSNDLTCELIESATALNLISDLHKKSVESGQCIVSRERSYWEPVFERLNKGKSLDYLSVSTGRPQPFFMVCKNRDNYPCGLAVYRVYSKWEDGLSKSELELLFLISVDVESTIALYNQLMNLPLIEELHLPFRPYNEVLKWAVADGRRIIQRSTSDHVWLRIVDVRKALEKRSPGFLVGSLVIEVVDDHFSEIGRFEVSPNGDKLKVEKTSRSPDVKLDVSALSSVYLSGSQLASFAHTKRISFSSKEKYSQLASLFYVENEPYIDTDF